MPTELAHIALANRCQKTIDYLSRQFAQFPDWIAVVAFYKALHVIEAVFARDPEIRHGVAHEAREQYLKRSRRYSHIHKHYRLLWAASTVARYLEEPRGGRFNAFSEYLGAEQVRTELLNHRLKQVEKSALKFMSSDATAALVLYEPPDDSPSA